MHQPEPWIAYHLTPADWYAAGAADAPYLPEPFAREGFIHLTHGRSAVLEAGNRYYRTVSGAWLALEIDLRKVTPEIRYEDPARQFPHIHGPLDRVAIVAVYAVERTADGTFSGFAPSPIMVRDPAS